MPKKPGKRKRICVLASGGLDSAILLHELLKKGNVVYPVYLVSGYLWEKTELRQLRRFLSAIRHPRLKPVTRLIIPASDLHQTLWAVSGKRIPGAAARDEAVYLPGRNITLIAKAVVFCAKNKIGALALGPLKSNPFPDATRRFFNLYERALSAGLDFSLKIETPFLAKTKLQVMRSGRDLPLELTFSCLNPKENRHCGRCNKCKERQTAFAQANRRDKTSYASRRGRSKATASR